MVTKKVKKLWKDRFVSVRDYEVRKAIQQGGMTISHGSELMRLTVDELRALRPTGQPLQSKYKGTYRLVDILFTPAAEHPDQGRLL